MDLKILKINRLIPTVLILSFLLAYFLPGGGKSEMIETTLGVVGLLFAILVGFFITDLWTRFQKIRENVAVEVSGLQTYYLFVKIMNRFPGHKEWAREQQELIDEYVRKFFEVEWTDYGKIDPYFNKIIESLKDVGKLKTDNEVETYTNMLPLLNGVTTSREKLFMYGKDKLSKAEWTVIISLASILLFSIFYLNTGHFSSILLTGALTSAVIILLLILRDLNNLSFGEEMVSFEPYETIFDVLGKPRFYLKKDIESGRVKPPRDREYRTD
ncbi:DUF4239 domain-containing protein [Patescibacteria group bacterium]|nr:DUF4239 domain-containing protein [Patescibacteria group bacterium]